MHTQTKIALDKLPELTGKHQKGYMFMEIVPEKSADKIFEKEEYQKWVYQKPYSIQVLEANILLLKNNLLNSDLKPENTIYQPEARKAAIIDLGGLPKIENTSCFDPEEGGYQCTKGYCPPELDRKSVV